MRAKSLYYDSGHRQTPASTAPLHSHIAGGTNPINHKAQSAVEGKHRPAAYLLSRPSYFAQASRVYTPLVSKPLGDKCLLMFLDHTQRRSTVGRTPLDE